MTMDEFISGLGNSTFELAIGGITVFREPINLYTKLAPPVQIEPNTFSIELPFNKFNDDIILISLQYHEVFCNIQLVNPNLINTSSLLVEYKYETMETRRELAQSAHEKPLQSFQTHYVNLPEPSDTIISELDFNLLSKGIFFDTDINNINSIKLYLNGMEVWVYNKVMIKLFGKNIGPNLYYFPFNQSVDLFNNSIQTYRSALNFSAYDSVKMKINFNNPIEKICFYSINLNLLRYMSGMAALKFSINNITYQTTADNSNYMVNNNFSAKLNKSTDIVWKTEHKLMNNCRGTMCPITYNEINLNESYCTCTVCKYNFSGQEFCNYIKSSTNKRCPMCKSQWTNWTMYINQQSIEQPIGQPIQQPIQQVLVE
jgi:hypothetical protein